MRAIILGCVLLVGCASNPPADDLVGMDIRVQFIPKDRWAHGDNIWGLAYVKDNTCILMFPAEWGVPGDGVLQHELRHCHDLEFHD